MKSVSVGKIVWMSFRVISLGFEGKQKALLKNRKAINISWLNRAS